MGFFAVLHRLLTPYIAILITATPILITATPVIQKCVLSSPKASPEAPFLLFKGGSRDTDIFFILPGRNIQLSDC